ncbi:UDP-N-acetylglucosamine 1-carboxyvinyltransferase [Salsuginibacillus kocurii]|uniref:UDP-N-acetylglucosamine 1-carboxyvinyltransferase n=1 Tax=Salsuginibacillus kocurii TaxID=427078 RepID=UPI00037F29A0|nr:UDP-N-acetylglucosamine 1-carboxyvinyltransferase [Salsuginibacillus kocurii]
MDKLLVEGGHTLQGTVQIGGAKNSAVALLPAALLADSTVTIDNLPLISDVEHLGEILQASGAFIHHEGTKMTINPQSARPEIMPNGQMKKLRASYYMMGAMLGKFKQATLGLPGGCDLGPRPIDQHIKGFEALGAEVTNDRGMLCLRAKELRGARIYLDVVSVGATINIMLAASRAKGQTIIENAAKEPEIIDVATLLSSMGAKIKGAGTDVIRIDGRQTLSGCAHSIIPDRIEAGTYMITAAAAGNEVLIDHVIPDHVEPLTAKLREMGVQIEEGDEQLLIRPGNELQRVDIKTLVHPGFPTDLQQPATALLTKAQGTSIITDTIYNARFKHVDELRRMGADVKLEGRSALITGAKSLEGAKVKASDLRAGAALVIAGLMADGVTEIADVHHIERGYERLEAKLKGIGAKIWRAKASREEVEALRANER